MGGKVYHLWPKGAAKSDASIQIAVKGIQVATELFLDRLHSELPAKDLRMQLQLFNLRTLRSEPERINQFRMSARMWFRLLDIDDPDAGVREYHDAVFLGIKFSCKVYRKSLNDIIDCQVWGFQCWVIDHVCFFNLLICNSSP